MAQGRLVFVPGKAARLNPAYSELLVEAATGMVSFYCRGAMQGTISFLEAGIMAGPETPLDQWAV